ncbi:MAG: helix-turn-helix transcriptional regulator [Nitrospirae bacterium]|nr:helix-turn-helix transcriptional regulator [Nitrospirota bacterium]
MFIHQHRVKPLLNLIQSLYTTPVWDDPRRFFTTLRRAISFDRSVAFMRVDSASHKVVPSPLTIADSYAEDAIRDHNEYFWQFKRAIIHQITQSGPQASFMVHLPRTSELYLSPSHSREYQFDYWERHKVRYSYACYTKTRQGYMATVLCRAPGAPDFSEEECALLNLLAPHLAQVANDAAQDAPTAFVDAKGCLLWTNALAERMFEVSPAFASHLRASLPTWVARPSGDHLTPFREEIRNGGKRHVVHVAPAGFGRFPLFRVSWTPATYAPPLPAEVLQRFARHHRLSPREHDVLACVVAGKQMKEMAQHLALAVDTVKEYLHSLYRKVGVDGRGPLVARLLAQATVDTTTR